TNIKTHEMKPKKEAYELGQRGNIIKYNVNYDIERFSFISREHSFFDRMAAKVNSILNGMVSKRGYHIDWKEVVDEYKETGVGDVPHFAFQYVFDRVISGKLKIDRENKQAMYLEIVNAINGEIEKGNLPA
ncbi:MAG: hypothetical protein AB3N10_04575, partial [Allomuricauda sp.]